MALTSCKDEGSIHASLEKAMSLEGESRVSYLTEYTAKKADEMLICWHRLATHLIVKFNDMIVKPEENGRFMLTPEGLGARVTRPGYSEGFARELIRQTGKKYEVPIE